MQALHRHRISQNRAESDIGVRVAFRLTPSNCAGASAFGGGASGNRDNIATSAVSIAGFLALIFGVVHDSRSR